MFFFLAIFLSFIKNFKPKNVISTHTNKQTIYVKIMAGPDSPYFSKKGKKKMARFLKQLVLVCSQNRERILTFLYFVVDLPVWLHKIATQNLK